MTNSHPNGCVCYYAKAGTHLWSTANATVLSHEGKAAQDALVPVSHFAAHGLHDTYSPLASISADSHRHHPNAGLLAADVPRDIAWSTLKVAACDNTDNQKVHTKLKNVTPMQRRTRG